jgi:hypothetical protein
MGLSVTEILLISLNLILFCSSLWLVVNNKPINLFWLIIILIFNPILGPLIYFIYSSYTHRAAIVEFFKKLYSEIVKYFSPLNC